MCVYTKPYGLEIKSHEHVANHKARVRFLHNIVLGNTGIQSAIIFIHLWYIYPIKGSYSGATPKYRLCKNINTTKVNIMIVIMATKCSLTGIE